MSNVEVTNNGATVNNAGKIGKCYNFNGTGQRIKIPNPINNSKNNFSICAWIYMTALQKAIFGARTSGSGVGLLGFINSGSTGNIYFDDGTRFICSYDTNNLLNSWHHIAFIKEPTKKIIYIDGLQIGYQNNTNTTAQIKNELTIGNDTYETYTGNDFIGRMNDVRIYDHCLSAAEVHEIAMGLVLHYKLDGGLFGNPNLLARYVVPGQAAPTSTANGGRTTWLGDYKITIPATENADTYFRLFMTERLISGTTYTISCKVSGLLNGSYYKFPLFAQNNTSMGVLNLDHNGLCSLTFTMNWTGTQKAATGANGETVYVNFLDDSTRSLVSGQGAITLYDFKLEKGDTATTWCPANNELAIDRTIISDSSGYGHNGIIVGTSTSDTSTPRYNNSLSMNNTGTSNHIETNAFTLPDVISVSFWAKANKSTNQVLFADPLNSIEFGFLNSLAYIKATDAAGWTTANFINNEWNHIVVEKNGSTFYLYINGMLETQNGALNYYIHNGTKLWLLNRSANNNYAANASISDFRIYCTALLDTDIKLLYKMGMRVDNLGGVHTFEYIEDEEEKNTLQGLLKTNEIEEYNGIAKIKKNKGWLSPNFIEV